MIYCRAKFGDGLLGMGMGFGNRLFPWARCRIFAHLHGAQVISPVWMRPAVGQIFRGGIDYRSYLRQLVLFGLFCKRDGDLGVIEGWLKTRGIPEFPEPADLSTLPTALPVTGDVNVVFSHYEPYFSPLNGWHDFLYRELCTITQPRYISLAESFGDVPIALCIRCGNDFAEPKEAAERLNPGEKTPVSWFVRCLNLIRAEVGAPLKAFVVSDGTHQQLEELLDLENVSFVRPGSAISDLLVLSRARVLVGAGSSSFAAWGCFLGQMPSISHPGQPFADWGIVPTKGQFIGEFNPADPSTDFLSQAATALRIHFPARLGDSA